MKNEIKFKEYMAALGEIHDRVISPMLMDLYWKVIDGFDDDECERAFKSLIYESRFFPKPADLTELLRGKTQDVAALKWIDVIGALKQHGTYESIIFSDPVIHSVIEAMGGWIKLGEMLEDEEKWKQKEFERLYGIMSKRGGDHPKQLAGICERDNAANGYDVKTEPIRVGFARKLLVA